MAQRSTLVCVVVTWIARQRGHIENIREITLLIYYRKVCYHEIISQ